jgi:VWFA-related protein
MTRLWYAGTIGLVALAAQQGGEQSAGPVIRVTVNLVQVDATVTDSKGVHVAELKPEDFEILEDGKPQKITHFSYVPGAAGGASAVPASKPAPFHSLPPAISSPAPALRPEEVHRTIVLMADDLALTPEDIPRVRKAMRSFIDRHMQTTDLAAVMNTSGGMGAMQQLTNDKRQLYAAIDRIHYIPARSGQTWYVPVTQPTADHLLEQERDRRLGAIRSPVLSVGTLNALAFAIHGLWEMPGRKAIAFFSDGISQSPGGIVQLANRASVAIYTLDARGLVSFDATALDAGPAAGGIKMAHAREAPYRASQTSLDQLARGTGGLFFHDENDLVQDLATALDDMRSYYVIGYQPDRKDFEKVRGQAQFHKTEVRVLRAGLRVRSRNGFVGIPDPPAVPDGPVRKSGKEELRKALSSPFHSNAFPVQLSAFYSAAMHKDPKTGKRPAVLRAMLAIDARGLKFNDTPDGKKQLDLDIEAEAYGADNEVVTSNDRTFHVAMAPDEAHETVSTGLLYAFEIEIAHPGPYQLRVAAWDANSERVGSASAFVEIPDWNRKRIALSSVRLYDSDAKRNEELTRAGVIGAGSPVTRVFALGAVLRYDYTVYGTRTGPSGKAKLAVVVRLFRGPEQIYNGQPIPLAMKDGSSAETVPATGTVKLPATLPPGDYALELSVYDELEKNPQSASQWVDFTLHQ